MVSSAIEELVGELSAVERVADALRQRHGRYGPKLDCDGLAPAASADGSIVYCSDCGLVLFRGDDG